MTENPVRSECAYLLANCVINAIAALMALAASGCGSIFGPSLPAGALPIDPPGVYQRWWRLTESCSGRSRPIASVQWYRTPGQTFTHKGQQVAALRVGDRIIIADDEKFDGPVVRHEMLHVLLKTDRHSRAEFLGSCASLLYCFDPCVAEAGPWTGPTPYDLFPAESLVVTVNVELPPQEGDGDRWMAEWVTVSNPTDRAVVISTTQQVRTPDTFAYQVWGSFGGIQGQLVASDSSTLFFGPRGKKQWLFEFRRGSTLARYGIPITLPAGIYRIAGGFARYFSAMDTITVTP